MNFICVKSLPLRHNRHTNVDHRTTHDTNPEDGPGIPPMKSLFESYSVTYLRFCFQIDFSQKVCLQTNVYVTFDSCAEKNKTFCCALVFSMKK